MSLQVTGGERIIVRRSPLCGGAGCSARRILDGGRVGASVAARTVTRRVVRDLGRPFRAPGVPASRARVVGRPYA